MSLPTSYNLIIFGSSPYLVISIPILLLYRVRISLRQKLSLIGLLSLSIVMIAFAIIRVAAADTINGDIDSIWVVFWFQVETSVAVIMVSVSAFRALFIAHTATRHGPSPTVLLPKPHPLVSTAESAAQTSRTLAPSLNSHEVWIDAQVKGSMESDGITLPMKKLRVSSTV